VIAELRLGKRLRVVKQPILALGDERVVGYELLSRLDLPHLELPEDFFRISMEASILTLVDHECLRRCVAASASLPPGTARHVNLFPSTLVDVPAEHLLAALGAGGVPPGTTCVEVSEQQIVGEPSYLVGPVAALRQAGVRFAIDDLGFGSSSIESLVLLEPDVVKIDRRFVRGIAKRRRQAGALERLLRVATSLGASVVAEGIETREDLKRLRELGVGYGQGFLWGPPR
jgi:EAL domain-containing protein (putative c-di-GMP-specific phosphodiesterase class I)